LAEGDYRCLFWFSHGRLGSDAAALGEVIHNFRMANFTDKGPPVPEEEPQGAGIVSESATILPERAGLELDF